MSYLLLVKSLFEHPTVVQILSPIIGALLASWILATVIRSRKGEQGENELHKIYRRAVRSSVKDRDLRKSALAVLSNRDFFEHYIWPQRIPRKAELERFIQLWKTAAGNSTKIENTELRRLADVIFANIYEGLGHSSYEPWKEKYKACEETETDSAIEQQDANRQPVYMIPILLNSNDQAETARHGADNYFKIDHRPNSIPPSDDVLEESGSDSVVDEKVWKRLLAKTMQSLRKAYAKNQQVHLAIATPTLWNYAFGTLLNNRFALQVYHFQAGRYYPIARLARRPKDLRSPRTQPMKYEMIEVEWSEGTENPPTNSEGLALSIGANPIANSVQIDLEQRAPGSPYRLVTKRVKELDPLRPADWVQFAAEIAHLICNSSAREIYLYADMPAVLALMVGDAIGPYCPHRVHLMQWDMNLQLYHEMIVLPDGSLTDADELETHV